MSWNITSLTANSPLYFATPFMETVANVVSEMDAPQEANHADQVVKALEAKMTAQVEQVLNLQAATPMKKIFGKRVVEIGQAVLDPEMAVERVGLVKNLIQDEPVAATHAQANLSPLCVLQLLR